MIDLAKILALPKLPALLGDVEQCLLSAVKSDNDEITKACTRIVKAGGKRLRPTLVIVCASLGKKALSQNTVKLAAAVELLHLGSLVHDDIIDEADTRWGITTINAQEGSSQAIIAGDYLLASACALAASVGAQEAKLVANTIMKLCEGQYLELADDYNNKRTEESYYKSIEGKTAALLSLSCVLGGMSAGLTIKQVSQLKDFGYNFGLSFQLVDDLMDLVSSEALYKKPVGNDMTEGVYTLPVILGLQSSKSKQVQKVLASKKFTPQLTQLLFETGAIKQTMQIVHHYNKQASAELGTFKGGASRRLQKLPEAYTSWVIKNLVSETYKTANF